MKHVAATATTAATSVTPFVGVWIETEETVKKFKQKIVTPFVGVWIETEACRRAYLQGDVTPFVGVWIETLQFHVVLKPFYSHTLRGCVD